MTHSRQAIRALLDGIGTAPRRDLGQNFVADPNTVRRIARLAGVGPGDHVVEIGAGLGSLTLALAETGADVTAVEVDPRIAGVLRTVLSDAGVPDTNVTVVEADAMTLDWSAVLDGGDHWTLVANLPYNVATPLVCDLLDEVPAIERMLVMVQREVADRFVADPGSKQYGAVSVKIAYWASARLVGVVPASVFVPRPNVESALVEIDAPPTAADRPRRAVLARADRVRPASQDVAPVARRARRRRRSSRSPRSRRRRGPSNSTSTPGADSRKRCRGDDRVDRAGEADARRLRITGRRDDGYHLIDAEMVSLDLHDVAHDRPSIETACPSAARSLMACRSATTQPRRPALRLIGRRAHVTIDKRIPPGGGLGGGSSDAAAVLRWGGFDDPAAAAAIGADVAFCLVGGRARVRGIGDIVDPLPFVERAVTLVVPPLSVSTPAVYRAWDDLGGPTTAGPNDLEPAAIAVVPELARWRDRIGELSGEQPILAGSGATWFVHGEHSNALAVLSDEGARWW